jgi:hypothetical protein
MPKYRPVTWYQGQAEDYILTVEDEVTELPQDLTDVTLIAMYIKATAETEDDDEGVVVLSTGNGKIVVTNAEAGLCSITAADTVTEEAGIKWYRILAEPGPKLVLYGPLTVVDT